MGKCFLVVDDSEIFRTTISKIIKNTWADAVVKEATDGLSAGVIVKKENPDVVLLDYKMPGMDGYAALKNIKSDPEHSHVKIICISGAEDPTLENNAKSAGADFFLKKPVLTKVLVETLKQALGENDDPLTAAWDV